MAAGGDHAGADVKTVQEILKSDGNDELKFGLLTGLIKVSQVSNKDVVNTVLHLVSWVLSKGFHMAKCQVVVNVNISPVKQCQINEVLIFFHLY